MLPEKILNAREEIKAKVTQTHGKYAAPNHIKNFKLVASPEIIKRFTNIVLTMDSEELRWNGWWYKGFKETHVSSHCPDHQGLLKLANEIAEEIYNECSKRG